MSLPSPMYVDLRAVWSALDGIGGLLKGNWGVLAGSAILSFGCLREIKIGFL